MERIQSILFCLFVASTVFSIVAVPTASSAEPTLEWEWVYGGAGHDGLVSVAQCLDGGYFVSGATESFGAGAQDMWLANINSAGHMQWSRTYGGIGRENCQRMIKTGDGGCALAGFTESFGGGGRDFWLVKTDSSGNHQWNRTYGGTGDDEALFIVQTEPDGGYALVGLTQSSGAGGKDMWLIETDANGNMEWNQTYGGTSDDWAFSVVQTSDGGFAIVGFTSSFGAGGRDVWLVKTDSAGTMMWNKTYGGSAWDEGYSVIQKHDGGYAIAGHTKSFGASRWDWLLLGTDSSGDLLWYEIYGGAYDDYAHFIQQTGDGGYVLAGVTQVSSVGGSFDGWLVKTDATGQIEWDQTFGEPNERDSSGDVIETSDGGYVLPGSKGGPTAAGGGDFDFWLIKLAPTEIPATVDIDPDTLNLKSNGQWITAYVELPEGYDVSNIDVNSILVNDTIPVDTEAPMTVGDYDLDSIPDLMVKFDRASIIEWLGTIDFSGDTGKSYLVTLAVTGKISGITFEGSDTVKLLH